MPKNALPARKANKLNAWTRYGISSYPNDEGKGETRAGMPFVGTVDECSIREGKTANRHGIFETRP